MTIKKENVIDICSNLLLDGEGEEAKEAVELARRNGVDITLKEVKDVYNTKTKAMRELTL